MVLILLEEVVTNLEEWEVEQAIEGLQDVEYELRELLEGEQTPNEQEALLMLEDVLYACRRDKIEIATRYCKMALDILTLRQQITYVFNKAGLDEAREDINDFMQKPPARDADINEKFAWEKSLRKKGEELTALIIADHRARFADSSI